MDILQYLICSGKCLFFRFSNNKYVSVVSIKYKICVYYYFYNSSSRRLYIQEIEDALIWIPEELQKGLEAFLNFYHRNLYIGTGHLDFQEDNLQCHVYHSG